MKENVREILLISDDNRFNRQLHKKLVNDGKFLFNLSILDSIYKIDTLSSEFDLIVIHSRREPLDSILNYVKSRSDKPIILSGRFRDRFHESLFENNNVLSYPEGIIKIPVLKGIIHTLMLNNQQNDELQRRDGILEAVNYAAKMFLVQPDWLPFIEKILARLGKATDSDRAFILKLNLEHPRVEKAKIFSEWAREGIKPQSEMVIDIFDFDQKNEMKSWLRALTQGKLFHAKVSDLSIQEQEFLGPLDIASFIIMPVIVDKKMWGFMGFNQCRKSKSWAAVEIEALNTAANIFSAEVARRKDQQQLLHMATHDYLTNLPNRSLFEDRFHQAKARADRSKEKLAVISIDLDKFKLVNDSWGHPVGDYVLVEIASRLNLAIRTADTIARIGGDEFSVIVEGIHDHNDLLRVMQKLDESLANPILHDGGEIHISASMGAAIFPDAGETLEDLMGAADKALYDAKTSSTRLKIFREEQYSLLNK
jgi:diguanylate cyclase (GGDEF)-like protein